MGDNIYRKDVSHIYNPLIPDCYINHFDNLKYKIDNAFPGFRKKILREEIDLLDYDENIIESVQYKAQLLVLYDLLNQGYSFSLNNNNINLFLAQENAESKTFIRSNMSFEKKVQIESPSVSKFIKKMEKDKTFNGFVISIKNLIGNSNLIVNGYLKGDKKIIQPYIQLADNSRDLYTGYNLKDIWRYFRFTWSIPYKNTPGRNLYYLVRDAAQPYHPIIGIFALGNCILNLTVRDNEIGWTIDAIRNNLKRKSKNSLIDCRISNKASSTVDRTEYIESIDAYMKRVEKYSNDMIQILTNSINSAFDEIYKTDLKEIDFINPSLEVIQKLRNMSNELREELLNTPHLNEKNVDYEEEALLPLYKKKRCLELSKLIEAKITFSKYYNENKVSFLSELLKNNDGIKAVNTALVSLRKTKIGSNMMEIIVCGSIPPYNEVLGGKLVSILACSPQVIKDYKDKYCNQISEIASRMAGKKIVRDSNLVFLGTTSLYTKCSSQYNRISVVDRGEKLLEYHKAGITEGFGTLFFSKETTNTLLQLQILLDGGRKINNVFGEGTSPRFRLLSTGFSNIGLKTDEFLKHNSPRIVYMMNLGINSKEFLLGIDKNVKYRFNVNSQKDCDLTTRKYIKFWYSRWFEMRMSNDEIISRLNSFKLESILLSNN